MARIAKAEKTLTAFLFWAAYSKLGEIITKIKLENQKKILTIPKYDRAKRAKIFR